MRLLAVLTGGFALIVSLGVAAAQAAVPGGTWHKAEELPGTATLNKGGNASNHSVSCGAAGNCVAAGDYLDGSGHFQAFVANETGGVWGEAEEAPGTAALNKGGGAFANSVSCASAGNCAAGGSYTDGALNRQAFVVNETNGTWGNAEEVAAALNKTGLAEVNSVSCASAGNCAAGGFYRDRSGHLQAFVVTEANDVWGPAEEAPGTATLNQSFAEVSSVSCASAGSCAAGGLYTDRSGSEKAFVVTETHGVWGKAKQVAAQDEDGEAAIDSVSCAAPGDCVAGGGYRAGPLDHQAFVATETDGVWGTAEEVPGTAALNTGGLAEVSSVSCASAGNCAAGGFYSRSSRDYRKAFVVTETHGVWGKAKQVAAQDEDGEASTDSVSCASAGNCVAGGGYGNRSGLQAFIIDEVNGVWGTAEEVPGTARLNTGGGAQVGSVSCASASSCSAGGNYSDIAGHIQVYVVNKS